MSNIEEIYKKEMFLSIDDYNKPTTKEGLLTLAENIIHLILMEPGTMQNFPDMGVGIGMYIFDLNTPDTLAKIRSSINTQIQKYVPNNNIQETAVESFTDDLSGLPILGIGFSLFRTESNKQENLFLYFNPSKEGSDATISSRIQIS